ncbi:MAG: S41 family peptidase [Melioribacteraceae bacterium]|nr:S41 family peptidase [Melioribacteraceae bacterium]
MKKKFYLLIIICAVVGMAAVNSPTDKYFDMIKNIEIYTNIYKELNTDYVDELDPSQLMRTGIDAMVSSLDPYTNYISESQIESYRLSSDGNFSGLGAQSRMIDDFVTVVEIYEGGSAHGAGLKVGDQILEVDGQSTDGKSNEDVLEILRGFPGSEVQLKVNRPGRGEKTLTLNRGQVNIPNVPFSSELNDGVGYISLTTFTANAGKNVANALRKIRRENPNLNGIILDLRSNGGGLLNEAINVSNVFIPQGKEVVSTKGKIRERDNSFKTRNEATDLEIPLAVLINKRSASASEIVSGVIQDYDRGVIIGQRSYGKGLVQNTKEVGYNARLKLTISKYYIPSGRCIQSVEYEDGEPKDIDDDKRSVFYTENKRPVLDGGGVTPDVKIEELKIPKVLQVLENENWIFNFVTQYCIDIDSLPPVSEFVFKDYKKFKDYLMKNKFSFTSETEKLIEKLNTTSKDENYQASVGKELEKMKNIVTDLKENDLEEFEQLIIKRIEEQIISRYYYQKGKIEHALKNAPEVNEAIAILNDRDRYESLLGASKG